MYILEAESSFDAAHFLAGYIGKCGNIHGHRWRVIAKVCGETLMEDLQNRGMLVDFKTLKADLKEIADRLDHKFIIEEGSLKDKTIIALKDEGFELVTVDFRPTAENFARWFYLQLESKGYEMKELTIYETPNNCATYTE